jgi:hypothetical protein
MQTMHSGVVHSQSTKQVKHSCRAVKKLANQLLVDWTTVFLAHYWKDSDHFVGASMLVKTADLSNRVQKIPFLPHSPYSVLAQAVSDQQLPMAAAVMTSSNLACYHDQPDSQPAFHSVEAMVSRLLSLASKRAMIAHQSGIVQQNRAQEMAGCRCWGQEETKDAMEQAC